MPHARAPPPTGPGRGRGRGPGRTEAVVVPCRGVARRGEARQAGRQAGGERVGIASLLPLKSTLSREFRSLMVEANRLH